MRDIFSAGTVPATTAEPRGTPAPSSACCPLGEGVACELRNLKAASTSVELLSLSYLSLESATQFPLQQLPRPDPS